MVGGHTEVSGAFLDHLEHGIQHADDRAEGTISSLVEAARSVEVTEQLVGAIDQVDDHARPTPPRSCHDHSRPVKMGLRGRAGIARRPRSEDSMVPHCWLGYDAPRLTRGGWARLIGERRT